MLGFYLQLYASYVFMKTHNVIDDRLVYRVGFLDRDTGFDFDFGDKTLQIY